MDDFFVLKFIVMKKDTNINIIKNSEIINISKLRDLKKGSPLIVNKIPVFTIINEIRNNIMSENTKNAPNFKHSFNLLYTLSSLNKSKSSE